LDSRACRLIKDHLACEDRKELKGHKVFKELPVQLVRKDQRVYRDRKALRDRKDRPVPLGSLVLQVPQVHRDPRVIRAQQVRKDCRVRPDHPVRKDQLGQLALSVHKAQLAHRERKDLSVHKALRDHPVPRVLAELAAVRPALPAQPDLPDLPVLLVLLARQAQLVLPARQEALPVQLVRKVLPAQLVRLVRKASKVLPVRKDLRGHKVHRVLPVQPVLALPGLRVRPGRPDHRDQRARVKRDQPGPQDQPVLQD
jgi:hypothetical protein